MAIIDRINGEHAEFTITDKFTFSDSSEFRKKLTGTIEQKVKSLAINLNGLNFMDSSGLGMFMVALKECQVHHIDLAIYQPRGDVKLLLQMTKSYERFKIVD
ncbi:MAG: STAS domain-containing protein [Rickettsiales bacterium]|nr:STAS domain-containing protein [Rickettsiales bacterium]